ncbi:MAG: hypothetical protein JKX70_06860 [Phycisphaerales bacterium]|nr:hypothetical protein [Phycisphaerales bacterium]
MNLIIHPNTSPRQILGEVREIDSNSLFAHLLDTSLGAMVSDPAGSLDLCKESSRAIIRCGDLAVHDGDDDAGARLLSSWSQSGWTKFDEELVTLDQAAEEAGIELMIRPSSMGMLSDAICTCSWARRSEDLSCTLLLDPIGWLVDSMLRDADDHLRRISDLCLSCPKIGAVLIRSVKRDESGCLIECSLSEGILDPGMIGDRLGELINCTEALIVLDEKDLDLLGL